MTHRFPDGMTVQTKTLAFRIWQAAEARGWDMTLADVADHLDVSLPRVRRVAQISGWLTRFRTTITDPSNYNGITERVDEDLEQMAVRA
ncbi:hypothetical protein [Paracoccus sp. 22332]|uniref:hypothetical protein n=1 Tax=Paracoccus sp. 22332 TaxID=3453913 RepID=UPI003F84BAA4